MPGEGCLLSLLIYSLTGFTELVFTAKPLTAARGTAGWGLCTSGCRTAPLETLSHERGTASHPSNPRNPLPGRVGRSGVMDSRRSLESAAHQQHPALHTDCCCHEQGHRPAPAAQQCQTQTCLAKAPSPRDFPGHRCMPGSFPRRPAAAKQQDPAHPWGPAAFPHRSDPVFIRSRRSIPPSGRPPRPFPALLGVRSPAPLPRHRRRGGSLGCAGGDRGSDNRPGSTAGTRLQPGIANPPASAADWSWSGGR